MAINFRAVASTEILETTGKGGRGRKGSNEFASCELGGNGYILTEGVDYVLDNSEDENLPKLSSVRQRLLNHAKVLTSQRKKDNAAAQDILVKTESRILVDKSDNEVTKIPVLWFQFNEGVRKARKKKAVAETTEKTSEDSVVSAE